MKRKHKRHNRPRRDDGDDGYVVLEVTWTPDPANAAPSAAPEHHVRIVEDVEMIVERRKQR